MPTCYLYGPPGSGKTTVGRALATALDLPLIDLDEEIERAAGMPIPEIFAAHGEARFREFESGALVACATQKGIVALGGGALLRAENRALAQQSAPVLVLRAAEETLRARLAQSAVARPLLGESAQRLTELLAIRKEHYDSFPRQVVSEGLSLEQTVYRAQVELGEWLVRGMGAPYRVVVRNGMLKTFGQGVAAQNLGQPVFVVSDENVSPRYLPQVQDSLAGAGIRCGVLTLPAGEIHKNIGSVARIWSAMAENRLERGSTVAALGGGVIGDMTGFAAATFLRGVNWVNVPTSLLAMVDASLGGKTGIDLPEGKNLAGAFHAPRWVLSDPAVLATLPEAELRSGLAEVVKHAVIADAGLFAACEAGWEAVMADLETVIRRAVAVKVKIIQEDPLERGVRAQLNLGHTVGHAIEAASGFRLRHGEAVAIGMVAEARLAEQQGLAQEQGLSERIAACLRGLGLPTEIPAGLDEAVVQRAMNLDKKRADGKVRFALPVAVGEVVMGGEVMRW
ncbi:MAG: hypothetical protein OHK0052_17720 [Anaerolineales bacterium]